MIVYNTTFHAEDSAASQFVEWLKSEYIPKATVGESLKNPRLTRVLSSVNDSGVSYSLQFNVASIEELQRWYSAVGNTLVDGLEKEFGNMVVGFSTLMEEVEL